MPSFPPRLEPVKKQNQLAHRGQVLKNAIAGNYSQDKLQKAAEKYRTAMIGLLKAKIHYALDMDYQKKACPFDIATLEAQIADWKVKSVEAIIERFRDL
ncbi:MAG: hypothetical protein IPN76_35225 [Saprospiraceae bacterium]|nr:hypothetical protein [Saprospiraceae bacterium]